MGSGFLIDTSAAIKYLNGTLSPKGTSFLSNIINTDRTISFITQIELQAWNPINPSDIHVYWQFVTQATIIGITAGIVADTIEIRKNFKLKMADAIIAVTAVHLNKTLVGDNDDDFSKVISLKYVNPRKM